MNFNSFEEEMSKYLKELNIDLSAKQIEQFYNYMNLLIEWNKIMNLTAIVEPKEIIIKHFIDSLMVLKCIEKKDKIIDVGTGAGFPGIPIKIACPETKIVLLDSLNKRISFLDEVIQKLDLKDITAVHGRAEDFGRDKKYRESFDVAVARAVAPLNVLLEYLMPFVKVEGKCICMKGSGGQEELENSKNAIKELSGRFIKIEELMIPKTDIKRTIIEIEKTKPVRNIFPRKSRNTK